MTNRSLFSTTSTVFFLAGVFAALMETVYGYFFGVWGGMFTALTSDARITGLTKVGETVLWGFLTLACLFISFVATTLARHGHLGAR